MAFGPFLESMWLRIRGGMGVRLDASENFMKSFAFLINHNNERKKSDSQKPFLLGMIYCPALRSDLELQQPLE